MTTETKEHLRARKLRLLILLQPVKLKINAIRDYVEAFDLYSSHEVTYVNGEQPGKAIPDLITYGGFDVLLIPHHCRVCWADKCFHPAVSEAIIKFQGYKALIVQDEYDQTNNTRQWILEHGIHHVFTAVPEEKIPVVYGEQIKNGVEFTNMLTGYVPANLIRHRTPRPLRERPLHIVYRCRTSGCWRGELCHQKVEIGKVVRAEAEKRRVPVDIEWTEEKLIFGKRWHHFLQSGRATLGTESGSNVFDLDGSITQKVLAALEMNPDLTYEDLRGTYFEDENLGVKMNQISPKFFEFIASGTALILFEGEYSGILRPHEHYIPLDRNYNNLSAVFEAIEDLPRLEAMVERAYADIIASDRYNYRAAVAKVDAIFSARATGMNRTAGTKRAPLPLSFNTPPTRRELWSVQTQKDLDFYQRTRLNDLHNKNSNYASMIDRRRNRLSRLAAQFVSESKGA